MSSLVLVTVLSSRSRKCCWREVEPVLVLESRSEMPSEDSRVFSCVDELLSVVAVDDWCRDDLNADVGCVWV